MKRFTPSTKKFLLAALLLPLALAGCLAFPLGDPEKSKIDPKLEGFWQGAADDGSGALYTLYPFDSKTYVVDAMDYMKEDGAIKSKSRVVYKAWLTDIDKARFMTLEPLAQRLTTPPGDDDKKWFVVLRLTETKEGLEVRSVAENFEPMKSAKSAADVEAVIRKNLDNPDLYEGTTTFHHLDVKKDEETITAILKPFNGSL